MSKNIFFEFLLTGFIFPAGQSAYFFVNTFLYEASIMTDVQPAKHQSPNGMIKLRDSWNKRRTVQKASFNELIHKYSDVVLRTASRVLGNTQQAQDVHQEVFLEIWRRLDSYNGQTNWDAYLYRTTVRMAIRFAKKSRIEQSSEKQPEIVTCTDCPEASLRTAELQQKLTGCLAKLPKRQAEVFVLSRMEGLSTEKIAEMLGCSQKTIRVHLHRAMKRLARELKDYLVY